MTVNTIVVLLSIINIIGFIIAAVDKHRARRKMWRVPEKTFFILALLGGCPGVYTGLLVFRHKTRHWYFMFGIPAIFILQIFMVYYLYRNLLWL